MLEFLKNIDLALFFVLNNLHTAFFDNVIYWGTQSLVWLPLYLFLLILVIRRFRWNTLWILLFIAVMILVSDQLANFAKDLFARPRPTHEPGLTGIHTVYGYTGGQFGFYSSHASNTMAIAVFLIILLRGMNRYLSWLILLWAFFMSYTRIYLGVHYPGDILIGMVAGGVIGWIAVTGCEWVIKRFSGPSRP